MFLSNHDSHLVFINILEHYGDPLSRTLEYYEKFAGPLGMASGPHESYKLSIKASQPSIAVSEL